LLGRLIGLSNLQRHEDAIAAATRMIELGTWFTGQAYYWRSWNHFSLRNSPAARADADSAKKLMANAALFLLSGLIEWRETRLEPATTELEESVKMDQGLCEAARALGAVRAQRGHAPEALAAFQQARQCFNLLIAVRREYVSRVLAGPESEATKARMTASHERAIADAETHRTEAERAIAQLQQVIDSTRKSA
jgi:tetratricopeptide (TPR) repeat protein